MNRREFLVTGFAGVATTGMPTAYKAPAARQQRQLFEWAQYHLRTGRPKISSRFLKNAGIAAMNRIASSRSACSIRSTDPVSPHSTCCSSTIRWIRCSRRPRDSWRTRTSARKGPRSSMQRSPIRPTCDAKARCWRLQPHARIEPPTFRERVFELRIYESHSAKAGKKKIEMFQ